MRCFDKGVHPLNLVRVAFGVVCAGALCTVACSDGGSGSADLSNGTGGVLDADTPDSTDLVQDSALMDTVLNVEDDQDTSVEGDTSEEDTDGNAVDPNQPGRQRTPVQEGLSPDGADIAMDMATGDVRAGRVQLGTGGMGGAQVECAPDDYVLANSVARFCVEGLTTSNALFFSGGRLIDAEPAGIAPPLGQDGRDRLDIATVFIDLMTHSTESVEVVRDGTAGPLAVVRVTGRLEPVMYIAGLVGPFLFRPSAMAIVTEYRLAPDTRALEVVTFVTNVGTTPINTQVGDLIFWGDTLRVLYPGYGPDAPPGPPSPVALMAYGPGVVYGWLSEDNVGVIELPGVDLPAVPLTQPQTQLEPNQE
ncbi:MAG: hypothetical protein AAFX99_36025, partial [Myxococcota bacterium]